MISEWNGITTVTLGKGDVSICVSRSKEDAGLLFIALKEPAPVGHMFADFAEVLDLGHPEAPSVEIRFANLESLEVLQKQIDRCRERLKNPPQSEPVSEQPHPVLLRPVD